MSCTQKRCEQMPQNTDVASWKMPLKTAMQAVLRSLCHPLCSMRIRRRATCAQREGGLAVQLHLLHHTHRMCRQLFHMTPLLSTHSQQRLLHIKIPAQGHSCQKTRS